MKTTVYLNGKKVTQKHLKMLLGEDVVENYIDSSKKLILSDPLANTSCHTKYGLVTLRFE